MKNFLCSFSISAIDFGEAMENAGFFSISKGLTGTQSDYRAAECTSGGPKTDIFGQEGQKNDISYMSLTRRAGLDFDTNMSSTCIR